jgi:prepilin-type N-terminal cleavage/methylation domain-containing protein
MRQRTAFTMIELVFVIVVIGIIAKFGVEFLIKAYDGYIFSVVQNRLQTQTETALEQITNRLQYRIKSSIIARKTSGAYNPLSNADGTETILEWVGYDIDGLRGTTAPTWSGFIDLASSSAGVLQSLGTNTTNTNTIITNLSGGIAGIANSAIFFIGGNSDVNGFGWDGNAINDNTHTMHPIQTGTNVTDIVPKASLVGQDAYEYYQLAWTAYALVWSGTPTSNITYATSLDDGSSTNLFSTVIPGGITAGNNNTQWRRNGTQNQYIVNVNNVNVTFTYDASTGSFTCNTADATTGQICKRLTN